MPQQIAQIVRWCGLIQIRLMAPLSSACVKCGQEVKLQHLVATAWPEGDRSECVCVDDEQNIKLASFSSGSTNHIIALRIASFQAGVIRRVCLAFH